MPVSRREFAVAAVASVLAGTEVARGAAEAPPGAPAHSPHGELPAGWMGKEEIAFLIYPGFTALDMVGPHHMLSSLMGATVHIVAKSPEAVRSDTGLVFTPSATFETCPKSLDVLCVPGGADGTLAAMQDDATLRFLKERGASAKHVTSVCTGSLLLGSAGLLDGYEATSHWAAVSLLPIFGAKPRTGRTVVDRNRITGGGVTAGVDFGLMLVDRLRDRTYAEAVQLMAEYAPAPLYDAGTPERAPEPVTRMMSDMFVDFNKKAAQIGRSAFERARQL